MKILKVRKSKFWVPPINIICQRLGAEWDRKSNLGWIGRIDTGGRYEL
jgi:hypothetical protein